jgi:hypothetical protein
MNKPQIGDMAYWFSKGKLVSSRIKGVHPEYVITKNEDIIDIKDVHTKKIDAIENMQSLLNRLLEDIKE